MEYIDVDNDLDENYLNNIIIKIMEQYPQAKELYKNDNLIRKFLEIEKDNHKYYVIIDNNIKEKNICNYFTSENIEQFKNDNPIWKERLFTINRKNKVSYSIEKQNSQKTIKILMEYFNLDTVDFDKKIEKFKRNVETFIPGIFIDCNLAMSILKENNYSKKNPFSSFDDELYIDNNNFVISHLDSYCFIIQKYKDDMKIFFTFDDYKQLCKKIKNDDITEDDIILHFQNSKVISANLDHINIFLLMFKDKTLNLFKDSQKYPEYPVDITSPDYIYNYRRKLYGASPMATVSDISRRIENFSEDGKVRLSDIVYRSDISDLPKDNKVFVNLMKKEIVYLKEIECPQNIDTRWLPEFIKFYEYLKDNQPNILSFLSMNFFGKNNKENINFIINDFKNKLADLEKENKNSL